MYTSLKYFETTKVIAWELFKYISIKKIFLKVIAKKDLKKLVLVNLLIVS